MTEDMYNPLTRSNALIPISRFESLSSLGTAKPGAGAADALLVFTPLPDCASLLADIHVPIGNLYFDVVVVADILFR